ncbi:MAG: hypothetical protein HGA76_01540 [Candidatus Firestonebacteria bacterium]|nr:hypothetical protein [Candidatus Firestonebacteria bacterium]
MTEDKPPKRYSRPKVTVNYSASEPSKNSEQAVPESWERLHNEAMTELAAGLERYRGDDAKLLKGFLEIANFMLKNTTGIGSNICLAECRLGSLQKKDIREYYTLVLTLLAYHLGRMLPKKAQSVWDAVSDITGDPETCRAFARELETCHDHEDGEFSSIRAGRKLWEHAAKLLRVKDAVNNVTGRIYYQTAPGQDLVYIMEQFTFGQ